MWCGQFNSIQNLYFTSLKIYNECKKITTTTSKTMLLSRFIKSDKISTKKTKQKNEQTKKVNKLEVATKRRYNQSNNYLLLNDVIFNVHDVKRNLSLHEMVDINGKDSWLESIF